MGVFFILPDPVIQYFNYHVGAFLILIFIDNLDVDNIGDTILVLS